MSRLLILRVLELSPVVAHILHQSVKERSFRSKAKTGSLSQFSNGRDDRCRVASDSSSEWQEQAHHMIPSLPFLRQRISEEKNMMALWWTDQQGAVWLVCSSLEKASE